MAPLNFDHSYNKIDKLKNAHDQLIVANKLVLLGEVVNYPLTMKRHTKLFEFADREEPMAVKRPRNRSDSSSSEATLLTH